MHPYQVQPPSRGNDSHIPIGQVLCAYDLPLKTCLQRRAFENARFCSKNNHVLYYTLLNEHCLVERLDSRCLRAVIRHTRYMQ